MTTKIEHLCELGNALCNNDITNEKQVISQIFPEDNRFTDYYLPEVVVKGTLALTPQKWFVAEIC